MHGDSSSLIGLFNGVEYSGSSQSRKAIQFVGETRGHTQPTMNLERWWCTGIYLERTLPYTHSAHLCLEHPWNWTELLRLISPHHHTGFNPFGDDSPRENHEIGLYWTAWRRFTSGMLVFTSVVSQFYVVVFLGPTKLTVWACSTAHANLGKSSDPQLVAED